MAKAVPNMKELRVTVKATHLLPLDFKLTPENYNKLKVIFSDGDTELTMSIRDVRIEVKGVIIRPA